MPTKKILIPLCLFLFTKFYSLNATATNYIVLEFRSDSAFQLSGTFYSNQSTSLCAEKKRPSPLLQLFHRNQKKHKKLTAALLAFPLPFGIVGLHRIYLGTAPYVPVVYIASFGGVLGLLPLIDFCFILLDKNPEIYENNKKVFMWVK